MLGLQRWPMLLLLQLLWSFFIPSAAAASSDAATVCALAQQPTWRQSLPWATACADNTPLIPAAAAAWPGLNISDAGMEPFPPSFSLPPFLHGICDRPSFDPLLVTGEVLALHAPMAGLSGVLPSQLFELTHLTSLDLTGNGFKGESMRECQRQ